MGYEDFTDYTELDAGNKITVNSALKATAVIPQTQDNTWLYDDKEAGHFGDFEHLVKLSITGAENASGVNIWGVSNQLKSFLDSFNASDELITIDLNRSGGGAYVMNLRDCKNQNTDGFTYVTGTDYYCTIKRDGAALTCKIYLDADRTNLTDTLTVVCSETTMRYVFAILCWHGGGAGVITAVAELLDLQEAAPAVTIEYKGTFISAVKVKANRLGGY